MKLPSAIEPNASGRDQDLNPRKLKLEFYDNDGVKHSVALDGPVTREKIAKLLDIVEIMSGTTRIAPVAMGLSPHKYDRLTSLIMTRLKEREFTAAQVRKLFEETYGDPITLSTVATYLSRLVERRVIERGTPRPHLHYRLMQSGAASRPELLPQTVSERSPSQPSTL